MPSNMQRYQRFFSTLFFLGSTQQRGTFFTELHAVSIGTQFFGIASWSVTWALMADHDGLNSGHAWLILLAMAAGAALTIFSRTLEVLVASGALGVVLVAIGYRVLMNGVEEPAFWVLPLGVIITLTTAPIFSGVVYYLVVACGVWLALGIDNFPRHAGLRDQYWPALAIGVSLLIGVSLNVVFLLLRIRNYNTRCELENLAFNDALTGMNNRRRFSEHARKLAAEYHGPARFFLMIDIDDFKIINDSYGHDVGDDVLKRTAAVIVRACAGHAGGQSAGHPCGRLGGEEFGLIFSGDAEPARCFAADLLRQVRDEFAPVSQVTVSIGIAPLQRGVDLSHSYKNADASLYAAKRRGKNQFVMLDF